jgi:hypothetical protein
VTNQQSSEVFSQTAHVFTFLAATSFAFLVGLVFGGGVIAPGISPKALSASLLPAAEEAALSNW